MWTDTATTITFILVIPPYQKRLIRLYKKRLTQMAKWLRAAVIYWVRPQYSLFWKKGSCKQKMFVCPTNQWAAFQNERGTPDFDAKLSGGRLSIVANRNLGSVLLETLLVSQKPIRIEFSRKKSHVRNSMRGIWISTPFASKPYW